ncbi:MAG: DNA repair protein RecO [Thalassobius sp.]|nr:DNA repair protein RecO [Thalassovita sp.]
MIFKTKGIVLNFVKFRDSSIIVKIYTEKFGLKTYIVNGVRSSKAKANKIAYYQPLSLLELVIYNRENRDINRISEVKIEIPYQHIPFDHKKNLMAIFITEVLTKAVKEEESNEDLFNFLRSSFMFFDQLQNDFENFHIQFLIKLTNFLGFAPHKPSELGNYPGASDIKDEAFFKVLEKLFYSQYDQFIETSGSFRTAMLEYITKFYQFHIEGFGEIKSLNIIKELH